MLITRLRALSLLFLLAVSAPALAADAEPTDPIEKLLKAADLPTDNDALLQFFKRGGRAPGAGPDIPALIKQLGDDDFDKREAASAALVKAGKAALPDLRKAAASTDREVSRRAAD